MSPRPPRSACTNRRVNAEPAEVAPDPSRSINRRMTLAASRSTAREITVDTSRSFARLWKPRKPGGADALPVPTPNPGDALLVGGGTVVHRTAVPPGMARARTSIELRLFAADRLPPRLAADRSVALD